MNKEETIRFKITGFTKFPDGQDKDCIAIIENGREILVDPFVGCAFKYENRKELLGVWWEASGNWWEDKVFLPSENEMGIFIHKEDMTEEAREIMQQFRNFTDGTRIIMLTQRSKEGGKSDNPDRVSKRKISSNRIEFESILEEFLEIKNLSPKKQLRIYSSVNKRDFGKGMREFKRQQLEVDYYDHESKCNFYLDIKNRFLSSIMKPSSRAETFFLIDCDDLTRKTIGKAIDEVDAITDVVLHYRTKNGYHIITKPFNPNDLPKLEIKKDALLLLSY